LEKYITTVIALHILRIEDEKNNVKKNNALAQVGRIGPEKKSLEGPLLQEALKGFYNLFQY
jgi:hypothetical protein